MSDLGPNPETELGGTAGVARIEPAGIAARLESWFPEHRRDLPWRRIRSPWRTLVSELMLQQTQVSRVEERFEAFMARFPDPVAMATAGEDAVVAAWEGLGYYRRARLLHAAAVAIRDEHGGEVPDTVPALLKLPGVGRYTAGSIASIAFDLRAPIVDGNVIRVIARLDAIDAASDDPALIEHCWARAEELAMVAGSPGVLNESLMELGATVCRPGKPSCDACPLVDRCGARRAGIEDSVPRPKQPPRRELVHLHSVLLRRGDRILLRRRPSKGIWAGLWELPSVQSASRLEPGAVAAGLDFRVDGLRHVESFRRLLTHREVHFHVHEGRTRVRQGAWCDREAASALGMSRPMRLLVDRRAWGVAD
ncbi:MAG: A/G-specific adenine glycosylase [Phycisphaerales bacterium]|nr:A/G-specific adenine glycosylase [Phycisphaerales bacterium]